MGPAVALTGNPVVKHIRSVTRNAGRVPVAD